MTQLKSKSHQDLGLPPPNKSAPIVTAFFEEDSSSCSYVVQDPKSDQCAIIDSVLDFDYAAGIVHHECADEIANFVLKNSLSVALLLETHIHADHLSAAPYLQGKLGGKIAISKHVVDIQNQFGTLFNEGSEFQRDGSQFDLLLDDDQEYAIGELIGRAMYTPGHTPACITHVIGDAAFVGDTLFMPDGGTARADFPGGDARQLYQSIQKILSLDAATRLYVCHDYQPNGRDLEYVSTIENHRNENIHVHDGISESEFVAMRERRDATLGMPRLIFPSLQVNMRAGHFPPAEDNGTRYLKVPINQLG